MERIERIPDEFAWATDGCPKCGAAHWERGCAAVLPVALLEQDATSIVLAYRCACGHDWTSGYERVFAVSHAVQSEKELRAGAPHFPAQPA